MNLFRSESNDPAFNLAIEEHLLKQRLDEWCFLYINRPSVVVGKHQNTLAEVNIIYALQHDVGIFRRISGGGAVYHDLGNLNFCFVYNREPGKQVDFQRNSRPVAEFLQSLGLVVDYAGANNIVYNGLKFSGNAEHVYKNRVLHHGTLLFDANLDRLNQVLTPQKKEYQHRGVMSKPWPIVNLKTVLPEIQNVEQLAKAFVAFMQLFYRVDQVCLSANDRNAIERLAEEKFRTWQWNFAYAADYTINRTIEIDSQTLAIEIEVRNGIICRIETNTTVAEYLQVIVGEPHHPATIYQRLKTIFTDKKLTMNLECIVNQLF